jgi:hypothetical protein
VCSPFSPREMNRIRSQLAQSFMVIAWVDDDLRNAHAGLWVRILNVPGGNPLRHVPRLDA